MAKSWKCEVCGETVSEIGSYAKLTGTKYAHLKCYRDELAEQAVEKYLREQAEAKADRERADADRTKAKEEAALAGLLALRAKGKDLWTRDDRMKLAEAKLICVHCGVPIGPGAGEARSGPAQKHCHKCYFASQYGEQQAAQTAAKSQAGIEAVGEALKKLATPEEVMAKAKEPEAAKEPAKKLDRFNLIDLD